MVRQALEFEKPIVHLKEKINELKSLSKDSEIDLSEEIQTLENRLQQLENDIYSNLKPWDRVQMARHTERPTISNIYLRILSNFTGTGTLVTMRLSLPALPIIKESRLQL